MLKTILRICRQATFKEAKGPVYLLAKFNITDVCVHFKLLSSGYPFWGHMQTVQTGFGRRVLRRPIKVYIFFLQEFSFKVQ